MSTLALTAVTLAAALWVGAIVFQSFFVAPVVFRELDEEGARRFLRAVFARFFRLGLACGAVMIAGSATAWATDALPRAAWLLAAAIGITVADAVCLRLVPAINAARDAGPSAAQRFRRLHGLSVALTLVMLVLGIAMLVMLAGGGR